MVVENDVFRGFLVGSAKKRLHMSKNGGFLSIDFVFGLPMMLAAVVFKIIYTRLTSDL